MTKSSPITCPAKAKAFIFAGNATFTVESKGTGVRFTYKLRQEGQVFFLSWLRGENNESDYSYIGYMRQELGPFYHGGHKAKAGPAAPCVKAFRWFYNLLRQGHLHPGVSLWHEGRCGACGRKLTVPSSIATGLGPECAAKAGSLTHLAELV